MADDMEVASGFEAEPVDWLWGDIIPRGMISLIAGVPDKGKSLFAAWLAGDLTRNGMRVITSNLEDHRTKVIIPRLNSVNAKMDRIFFYTPFLPSDTEKLKERIDKHQIDCVILDPASAHIGASIYNDQEVRKALSPLSRIAWETDCAIILIHHTIKSVPPGGNAMDAIGGSGGGLRAVGRTAFIFGQSPNDEDERVLAPAKFNIGPWPTGVVFEMDEHEWAIQKANGDVKLINAGKLVYKHSDSKIKAITVLESQRDGHAKSASVDKKAEAAEWVTNYLAFGTRKQSELAEDCVQQGHTFRTLRRAAEEIGIVKERRGFGKDGYWVWRLPEGHPSIIPTCCKTPEIVTEENLQQHCASCKAKFGLTDITGQDLNRGSDES